MSPRLVQQLAPVLADITPMRLQQMYAKHDIDCHEYEWNMFDELKSAYVEAASTGNALMIVIV